MLKSLQFELPFVSILFTLMLVIVYFTRKREVTPEYKLFGIILVASLIDSFVEGTLHFLCSILSLDFISTDLRFFFEVMNKVAGLLYVVIFVSLFNYIIIIYNNTEEMYKKLMKRSYVLYGICAFVHLFTRLEFIEVDGIVNVRGSTTMFSYAAAGLFIFLSFCLSFYKVIKKDRRYRPILLICIMLIASAFLTYVVPGMILYSVLLSADCYILYFSLEFEKEQKENQMRDKNDFLASMSHEIRTPLNAIVGLSQVLSTYKGQMPEEANQDIDDIVSSSTTLLEIVGNILDMNKIESDDFVLDSMTYNFKDKVSSLVDSYRMRTKPGVEVIFSISDNVPKELIGDSNRMLQIINNLVSNSVKFTDNGYVKVNVTSNIQDSICNLTIIVEDTGKGIRKEDMDKLFTKFERLDVEINSTVSGTGLGLAITKKLINIMNGNIEVKSEEGKGTKFIVTIPQEVPKDIEVL